jgi:hypothetical protein
VRTWCFFEPSVSCASIQLKVERNQVVVQCYLFVSAFSACFSIEVFLYKGTVKRKYRDSYLDIGFVETSDNTPQCVICGKVLPNSPMFPAKMRRHFEGVHPDCKDNQSDFVDLECLL